MKTLKSIHVWLKGELALIHLVDKFLIVFMAVLLAQSAYSLFTNLNSDSKVNDVDVIIRTSSDRNQISCMKVMLKDRITMGKTTPYVICRLP